MADNRPNLLLLITDQQRADFFAREGFGIDTMPCLETAAGKGTWFGRAYSTNPVCIPARISIMTGRFSSAHGVIANWARPQPRCGPCLPQVLAGAGYETAMIGKNHTHLTAADYDVWRDYMHCSGPPRPGREREDADFDRWLENLHHWTSFEPNPFPLEAQYPCRIVDDTIAWLRERDPSRPFFAYVSFPEPHSPYQVPEPYFSLFADSVPAPRSTVEHLAGKPEQWRAQREIIAHYHPDLDAACRRYRANYCGMLRLIDDQLGRLLSFMEANGLLENTLCVFTSDHGEFCGEYGLFRKGLGVSEDVIRVPMTWFGGPVQARAQPHPAHASLADVMPTMLEAAGCDLPAGVQGRSLLPLLTGEAECPREFASIYVEYGIGGKLNIAPPGARLGRAADTLCVDGKPVTNFDGTVSAVSGYRRALVMGRWKLVFESDQEWELYDLENDPAERENLASRPEHRETRRRLAEEMLRWAVRVDDNLSLQRYEPLVPPHNWYWSP